MSDLHQIELALRLPEGLKIHSSMGSVFHGMMMDVLGQEVAQWLHEENSRRPFSQCVYYNRDLNVPVWRLSSLTQSADERIVMPIYQLIGKEVFLKQKKISVELLEVVQERKCSYQELMDRIFLEQEHLNGGRLEFISTGSFKREGQYVILPELYLIFQSLIQRWNSCCAKAAIMSEDLEHQLADHCHISRYNLRSQKYSVNGSNIYGFCGNMDLRFSGNDMVRRLMELLLCYAGFAGIGVKTALGMGAVEYVERNPRRCP